MQRTILSSAIALISGLAVFTAVHAANDEPISPIKPPANINLGQAELGNSTLSDYLKDICVRHDVQCKSLVI